MKNVAIIGMGCISGAGIGVEANRQAVRHGIVRCGPAPEWLFYNSLPYPVFATFAEGMTEAARQQLAEHCSGSVLSRMSRTTLLSCSAVMEALNDAGLTITDLCSKRVGIAIGTTVGCTFHDEEYYIKWRQGLCPDTEPVTRYLAGNPAQTLHALFRTEGPAVVVTNACASGTDAIGLAGQWLTAGMCDLAIAGGADGLSRVAYNGFIGLMLADRAACRPFSRDREGLNLGEGAGIMVLEREEIAVAKQREPLGWIRGYGTASDGYHPTAPHPEGRGLQEALRRALAEAGGEIEIGLVNCHGTGTRANDAAEAAGLYKFFGPDTSIPFVSTKGITGHTLGAAGAIEAIFTLLALREGETRGTAGCVEVDEQLGISPLPEQQTRVLCSKWGISESLAFGGGNSVLVLEAAHKGRGRNNFPI